MGQIPVGGTVTRRTPIAVIGAGAIGRTHIDRVLRGHNLALTAIVDPAEAGRAIARRLGLAWFAEVDQLLEQARPAGALIATPNATHVPIALACLDRQVPVLIEKPVAATVGEARRLVEAVDRTGVPVLVGHHRRHNPILARARSLIAGGRLGRLVAVHSMCAFLKPDSYFEAAWRREPGGGPVLINLIHDIDLLRFLAGEIVAVQAIASQAVRDFAVEDSAVAVLRFANGALGSVLVSDTAASPWSWDLGAGESDHYPRQSAPSHFFCGTAGSLSLPDLSLWRYAGPRGWHDELTRDQTVVHRADPYERQLQHFRALIEGEATRPLCSALDGLRTLEVTQAVLAAAHSGGTVGLS